MGAEAGVWWAVMTWGELKRAAEALGVDDDTPVGFSDGYNCHEAHTVEVESDYLFIREIIPQGRVT